MFIFQRILSEVQAAPSPGPSPQGSPQLRRKLAHTVSLPVESFGHYLSTMGVQAQSKDNVQTVHIIDYSSPSYLIIPTNLFSNSCANLVIHKDDIPKLIIVNILITHLLDNIRCSKEKLDINHAQVNFVLTNFVLKTFWDAENVFDIVEVSYTGELLDLRYSCFILEPFKEEVDRRRRNLRQETPPNFSVTGKESRYRSVLDINHLGSKLFANVDLFNFFQKFEGDIERENAESLAADIAEFLNNRRKRSRAGTMPVKETLILYIVNHFWKLSIVRF